MIDIKSILQDIGYSNIKDNGKELRMRPIYRDSDNDSVLAVKKDTGHFIDFSKSISGSFEYLIQISLNLKSIDDAKQKLQEKWSISEIKRENRPLVAGLKIFPISYLNKILPIHSYWENRGIRKETLDVFRGGIVEQGSMANRYVFPILSSNNELIGVTGRYVKEIPKDKNIPKWLHKGRTSEWKYPLQVNAEIIKEKKEVILIESIGDMLSLWQAGIKNTIVVFGLHLSPCLMSLLIKLNLNKILVSFNDDSHKNGAGNKASKTAIEKLQNHFDKDQIKIAFPTKNDFGEMNQEELLLWKKKYIF